MDKKKCIVIGGSGFVGSNLISYLENYEVINFDKQYPKNKLSCQTVIGDILNMQDLYGIVERWKPDVIFDCCGVLGTQETFEHIQDAIDVNIKGVVNLLDVCQKNNIAMVYLTLINNWMNPYTITKQTAEKFCMMYAKEYGTKVSCLGALNIYGPGQLWKKVKKFIPNFTVQALHNEPIYVVGDGEQIVDAVHIEDICKMMIAIYEKGVWGETMHGGSGEAYTINEIVKMVLEAANSKSSIKYIQKRKGEPERSISFGDISKTKRLIDYTAQIKFQDGIHDVVKWYADNLDYDKD